MEFPHPFYVKRVRGNTMGSDTDLKFDLNRRMDGGGYKASSMDRYELRPFAVEAEKRVQEVRQKEKKELEAIRESAFSAGTDSGENELAAIREQVFWTAVPLVRETEAVEWDKTSEFLLMSICLFVSMLAAVSYMYAGRKKRERERHLADIDNRYKE